MAQYIGYETVKNAPTIHIDTTSGTHSSGYFNDSDNVDPPRSAIDCTGGLSKTIQISFTDTRNGMYYLERWVTAIESVRLPHKTNSVYLASTEQTIQSLVSEGNFPFVRCGFYIKSVEYNINVDEQYEITDISYTSIGGWDICFKVIDIHNNIIEIPLNKHNIIISAKSTHSWAVQREDGTWIPHEEIWQQWDENRDGVLASEFTSMTQTFWSVLDEHCKIECNIPFFTTEEELDNYLETGVMVDPTDDPTDNPNNRTYYIETNTIKNTVPKVDGATWVNHHRQEFLGYPELLMKRWYSGDNTLPLNMKWGYNVPSGDDERNMYLISGKEILYNEDGGIDDSVTYDEWANFINPWHCGDDWHQGADGYWYKSDIQTNIALVGSEDDDPQPPSDDPNKPNPSGEDDPSTVLPPNTLDCVGGRIYILSSTAMGKFIDGFFDEDDTVIDALLKGLKMFGQDPTQSIIDIYASPINLKTFCTTSSVSAVKVGNYGIDIGSGSKVLTNRVMYTLGQISLRGTYGDWRDLDANYYLYLPYMGFTKLDTPKYINKLFTIKMVCDIRTGNIKYYLFSGGNVVDTYECCVHLSCPLTNANYQNVPNKLVNASQNLINGIVGVTGGESGMSGVGGIITGGSELIQTGLAPREVRVSGNWSSETCVNDCNYPYIIIEQPEYLYPPKLYEEFGYPDDSIASLGNYKGYIECKEVNLNTTATKAEIEEIKRLLSEGVYI